jgi:hypothetical protein
LDITTIIFVALPIASILLVILKIVLVIVQIMKERREPMSAAQS